MEENPDAECHIKRNASPTVGPDDGNLESEIDPVEIAACRN